MNAPTLTLDSSWQAVLEYAVEHHFQFGRDIVFTYGPLGFLWAIFGQGLLLTSRVVFALFWSGIIALSATATMQRTSRLSSFVFAAWFVLAVSREADQVAFFTMAFGTILLFIDDNRSGRWQVPVFFLTFLILALVKFTFLVVGAGSLGIIVAVRLLERRVKEGLTFAASAAGGFVLGWFALGQSVRNIPNWIWQGLAVASGYGAAMSIVPKENVLTAAVLALALFVLSLALLISRVPLQPSRMGVLLTLALYVFLAWKEGFVRADGHVFKFILFLPLASSLFFLPVFGVALTSRWQCVLFALYAGIVLLCLASAHFQEPGSVTSAIADWPKRVERNLKTVDDIIIGRAPQLYAGLRAPALLREPNLPTVTAVMANGTVDVMDSLQWAALANQINYRPRPVMQGYSAYTPYLQDLNAAHFSSSDRPDFVLLSHQATDGKFPTLEDSAALNYVLTNYTPIARDRNFLVLRQAGAHVPSFQLLDEWTLRFGEELNVSQWAGKPLFMSVSIQPTLLGRVSEFFYQQSHLHLHIFSGGVQKQYRFVPEMAKLPFLLSPVLDNNVDVLALYGSAPWQSVDKVVFDPPRSGLAEFRSTLNVRLYTAPGFPAPADKELTSRMAVDWADAPFWPPPLSVESWAPRQIVDFFGTPGMQVHAPGKVVLAVPKGAKSFSGFFGLLPGAYIGKGKTDGVEFSIDVQAESGKMRRAFERLVQPVTQAADRGRLAFEIPVDSTRDRKLILTTGVAPTGHNNWDWSVWSHCRFGAGNEK